MRSYLLVALMVIAAPAHAQIPGPDKTEAEALAADAQAAFDHQQYDVAATKFKAAADKDKNNPGYIFNAAQAARLAKNCGLALEFYSQFKGVVHDLNVGGMDKVDAYIDQMRECARDKTEPTNNTTPPPQPPQQPPPQAVVQQPPPPRASGPSDLPAYAVL